MGQNFTKFAFTEGVKAAQEHYGSRDAYLRMEQAGDRYVLTDRESEFIRARDSFYMATVGENGWPYVQFRGGPQGFLNVLDERTVGFADFRGNRQYISVGNLKDNERVALILMDYPGRKRLKIWATARVADVQDDPELSTTLTVEGYDAKVERAIMLTVQAYDWNCPQHIVPRYTSTEISREIAHLNPDVVSPCDAESTD
ncbi:MAG: pyridoxamine 5'-phosphate oxidase family protein [Deltaproteobacteria bacterium]|nr:pyridoxamine 5'-phosphate oxidase family protein [Deltaproteobacteria bacterium]